MDRCVDYSDLLTIPFRWGGRDFTGVDCWGLMILFYRRLGIELEDPVSYIGDPEAGKNDLFLANKQEHWIPVNGGLRLYDLLLFAMYDYKAATHVGILLKDKKVLQATEHGVGVIRLSFQKKNLFRVYRHRCLA